MSHNLCCLPVRFAEFGRAMAARSLEDAERPVHYFGFVLNEMESTLAHVRSNVYAAWDANLNLSPPRSRLRREEQSEQERPSLELLAWANNGPIFPAALLDRFGEATPEYAKLKELKADFLRKYPAEIPSSTQPSPNVGGSGRAGGQCDYTIDENLEPLNPNREIDLAHVAASDFSPASRWAGVGLKAVLILETVLFGPTTCL